MTIKRMVNGTEVEFELSDRELYNAYKEQEHEFDTEDVLDVFDAYEDNELVETYGKTRKDLEAMAGDIAYEMRRNIDKYEMSWEYARDDAVKQMLGKDN